MTRKGEPQPQWTRKQEIQICRMREAGRSIGDIAAAVAKTYAAVAVRLSRLGATKPAERPRRKRGEFLRAVAALCGRRMSDKDIAAALGAYPQEVFKARKKLGIKRQVTPAECARRAWRSRKGHPVGGTGSKFDATPLTLAQQELVAANIRLAYKIANDHAAAFPGDPDAVESAALFALCRAARGYDPAAGVTFATYAHRTVALAVLRDTKDRTTPLGYRQSREKHLTPPRVTSLNEALT